MGDKRRFFNQDEKIAMLEKSNFKCSHCGKLIGVSEMTVEHVIPLSRGGTNDMSNLVALCQTCNQAKDFLVIEPRLYYKYLKPDVMDILEDNQINYYSTSSWFGHSDIMRADIRQLSTAFLEFNCRNDKFQLQCNAVLPTYKVEKTYYYDLNEVYEFCLSYNKKYNISLDIKNTVSSFFVNGALYTIRKPDRSIVAVLPMFLDITNGEHRGILPYFANPIVLYNKPLYGVAIVCAVHAIVQDLQSLLDVYPMPSLFCIHNTNPLKGLLRRYLSLQYLVPQNVPTMPDSVINLVLFRNVGYNSPSLSVDKVADILSKASQGFERQLGMTLDEFSDDLDRRMYRFR